MIKLALTIIIICILPNIGLLIRQLVLSSTNTSCYKPRWKPLTNNSNCYCQGNALKVIYNKCRPCPNGSFTFNHWITCRRWLDCNILRDHLLVKQQIGSGAIRDVYLAKWNSYSVALSILANHHYRPDFMHGISMIISLQSSPFVIKFLGMCNHHVITEYHPYGSADNIQTILQQLNISHNANIRYQLALDYVNIIHFLHNSPRGTLVMCDSNNLIKTLSQYVISQDLRMILNDVDALPYVDRLNNQLIKCGRRQLFGDFVAPEQLWPYPSLPFNDSQMLGYDEKTDIWKLPKVTEYILTSNDCPVCLTILHELRPLHKLCRLINPKLRPTSSQILKEYYRIKKFYTV
ncbi:uncharacterized protein TRIADDRAFT_32494 [Trichoplax adhaerens]|uniref:Protein kinase domain-containing protein n=1 Tax=Trichoplax adhaerens TaxID=10228 RepID=B3SB55_TRIAD|nr:hypothetical protein TRIADDRAFT_32494 [Trichoplax adhaerens]EDV20104.1 hypothetical protein TRIADDRAFT_32494 [Trichoplax adhaerens]|eukprot:XP_002117488.1 hypothetical protein TRIADDRAFT_32494 [Trichoplax adhaerens]